MYLFSIDDYIDKVHIFWEGHKILQISTVDLTGTTWDKSTVEILQNFVAFSEYMNFIIEFWFILVL